jgi:hypothetical protein
VVHRAIPRANPCGASSAYESARDLRDFSSKSMMHICSQWRAFSCHSATLRDIRTPASYQLPSCDNVESAVRT